MVQSNKVLRNCLQALKQSIDKAMPATGRKAPRVPFSSALSTLHAASAPFLGDRSAAFAHYAACYAQCAMSLDAWDKAMAAACDEHAKIHLGNGADVPSSDARHGQQHEAARMAACATTPSLLSAISQQHGQECVGSSGHVKRRQQEHPEGYSACKRERVLQGGAAASCCSNDQMVCCSEQDVLACQTGTQAGTQVARTDHDRDAGSQARMRNSPVAAHVLAHKRSEGMHSDCVSTSQELGSDCETE